RIYAAASRQQKRLDVLYRLVFNLIYTGNRNRDVASLLDTIKAILNKYFPQDRGLYAKFFFLRGCREYFLGHYPESISLFRESIRMASGTTLRWTYRAAFHRYLALAYQGIYDFRRMEEELKKALSLAIGAEAPPYQYAWDLHELSILYISYLGLQKKGIEYGLKALEAYKSAPSPNPDMIIQMTTTIGLYYQIGFDLTQANQYFTQAENLIVQNKHKNIFLLKNLYSNIGGWSIGL
ncbi:MAG: hypothetical protein GXO83_12445, partial [Chlorobi bacterium]|nr:hypothetical protein [Chlorobiota bacterium]